MSTYPPNQTTPKKDSSKYLWNWTSSPLAKFATALQPYLQTGGGANLEGSNYIFVKANGSAVENRAELDAAYATALTMSPSAANRVTIIAAPGYYDLTGDFTMSANGVNLVSLDGNRSVYFVNTGTFRTYGDYVTIHGIDVGTNAFKVGTGLLSAPTIYDILIENCKAGNNSFRPNGPVVMEPNQSTSNLIFRNCIGGDDSFCNYYGYFYPLYYPVSPKNCRIQITDCSATGSSFDSIHGGILINCKLPDNTMPCFRSIIINCFAGSFTPTYGTSLDVNGYVANCYDQVTGGIPVNIQYYTCYVKGTLITLHDGSKKAVEDITYYDILRVWNFDEGKLDKAAILWIMKPAVAEHYWKITLSDDTELNLVGAAAGSHRLFNIDQGKFMYPQNFILGERTYKEDGSIVSLVSVEKIEERVEYYNLEAANNINAFANGVLCGSRFSSIYPVVNMRFVKDEREILPRSNFYNIPDEYYYGLRLGEQRGLENVENHIINNYLLRELNYEEVYTDTQNG